MVNTEIRLIMLFAVKDRETLYSQKKTRPGADCGPDHELLIAKFRLKLKIIGKRSQEPGVRFSIIIDVMLIACTFEIIQ